MKSIVTSKKTTHLTVGEEGEKAAALYLQKKGYTILHRNWRHGKCELDIIATKKTQLCFIEVKTRSAGGLVSAQESLSATKTKNFIKAVQMYLTLNNAWDNECCLDFIYVTCQVTGKTTCKEDTKYSVEHIQNAITISETLDSGYTTWQPY